MLINIIQFHNWYKTFWFFINDNSINLGSFSKSEADGVGLGWGKLNRIIEEEGIGVICPV